MKRIVKQTSEGLVSGLMKTLYNSPDFHEITNNKDKKMNYF